jgi:hypothetical protein
MRLSTLALTLSAASLLAACGHHKETIVERPGQTVVVTPPSSAAGGTVGGACTYNSATYSNGGLSCQSGHQYLCNNGQWQLTTGGC